MWLQFDLWPIKKIIDKRSRAFEGTIKQSSTLFTNQKFWSRSQILPPPPPPAVSSDGSARLWDCGSAKCLATITNTQCPINACAVASSTTLANQNTAPPTGKDACVSTTVRKPMYLYILSTLPRWKPEKKNSGQKIAVSFSQSSWRTFDCVLTQGKWSVSYTTRVASYPGSSPVEKRGERESGRTDHVHPWCTMRVFMHGFDNRINAVAAHAVPSCLRSQNEGSGEASFVDTNSTDRGGAWVWGYHKGSWKQIQDEVCSKIFRPTFFSTLVKLQLQTGN